VFPQQLKKRLDQPFEVDGSGGEPALDRDIVETAANGAMKPVTCLGFAMHALDPDPVADIGRPVAGQFPEETPARSQQGAVTILDDDRALPGCRRHAVGRQSTGFAILGSCPVKAPVCDARTRLEMPPFGTAQHVMSGIIAEPR